MKTFVIEETDRVLLKNKIFENLSSEKLIKAKQFFALTEKRYKKDEFIKRSGDDLNRFGIVIDGSVIAYIDDIDGNMMIMANVLPSEAFGEALCFLEKKDSPIYIKASSDCKIAWLSLDEIKSGKTNDVNLYSDMVSRYIAMISECMLTMNERIQILSKPSLREKLITFLSQCEHKYGEKSFDISMSRFDLALYLGVNRSALSRELSAMQKEGIIDFYKSFFKIIKRD